MGDGVLVHLRLPPKASANRITGIQLDAEGNEILKAQVTTVPEGGKADAAPINARWYKMLAREWKLAKSSINLVHGAPATAARSTSRHASWLNQIEIWFSEMSVPGHFLCEPGYYIRLSKFTDYLRSFQRGRS